MRTFNHRYGRSKSRGKHNIFAAFNLHDLADAIGTGYRSLLLYLKRNPLRLDRLSLREVNELINTLKDKKPLNTDCPRAKPKNSKVEEPDLF